MNSEHAARLLARHTRPLSELVRVEARGLLRFESQDDLLQGIRQRVLEKAAVFEQRSDAEALGWLRTVARNWLLGRRAHWSALKRDGGALLRLTAADGSLVSDGVLIPAASVTGPSTLADRMEQLTLATRALALLPERDRLLVRWTCQDLELAEMAARLDVSVDSTGRARSRALERLRKTYRLVSRAP